MAKTTKFYGTGRRKSSIARVYITPGTGKIVINKKDMDEYFGLDTLKVIVSSHSLLQAQRVSTMYSLTYVVVVSQVRLELSDMVFQEHSLRLMLSTDQSLRRLDTLQEIQE